jgi:hypothetical protein
METKTEEQEKDCPAQPPDIRTQARTSSLPTSGLKPQISEGSALKPDIQAAPQTSVLSTTALPAFGGGLTYCAHLVRWSDRVTPIRTSEVELPPSQATALELIADVMRRKVTPAPLSAGNP